MEERPLVTCDVVVVELTCLHPFPTTGDGLCPYRRPSVLALFACVLSSSEVLAVPVVPVVLEVLVPSIQG